MSKSINLDHSRGKITTADGCLILNDNGSVKVGNGMTLPNSNENGILINYEGAIRFNEESKKLEYCNGDSWVEFSTENIESKDSVIYSLLF